MSELFAGDVVSRGVVRAVAYALVLALAVVGAPAAAQSSPPGRVRGQILTVEGRAHEALWAADVVLTASGTAALEAGLAETPMVVAHRIHSLSYRIVRLFGLLKSKHVSLPNILLNQSVVPELLQDDCTVEKITDALLALFRDEARMEAMQTQLSTLLPLLGGGGADAAAEAVADLLPKR
jgi:lipid-A-disaccharide synthase